MYYFRKGLYDIHITQVTIQGMHYKRKNKRERLEFNLFSSSVVWCVMKDFPIGYCQSLGEKDFTVNTESLKT